MHTTSPGPIEYNRPSLALGGNCGYTISGDRVIIDIEAIRNDRPIGDISGTVAIELWALAESYDGGDSSGMVLAATSIGEIKGQHLIPNCRYDLVFRTPPQGEWYLVLMLREWTASGYVTRDHVQFPSQYRVDLTAPLVRKEADNVINADPDPAKRPDVVEESRKVDVEAKEPKGPAAAEEAPEKGKHGAEISEPVSPKAKKSATKAAKAEAKSSDTRSRGKRKAASISVNHASREEIAAVKGISRKLAKKIVASRPFESTEDLLRVKGIDSRLLAKIRSFIST